MYLNLILSFRIEKESIAEVVGKGEYHGYEETDYANDDEEVQDVVVCIIVTWVMLDLADDRWWYAFADVADAHADT